jgi:hypothetical protein
MKLVRRILIVLIAAAIFSAPLTMTGCVVDEGGHHHWAGWHHDH